MEVALGSLRSVDAFVIVLPHLMEYVTKVNVTFNLNIQLLVFIQGGTKVKSYIKKQTIEGNYIPKEVVNT